MKVRAESEIFCQRHGPQKRKKESLVDTFFGGYSAPLYLMEPHYYFLCPIK
jgi:hypothetical protein